MSKDKKSDLKNAAKGIKSDLDSNLDIILEYNNNKIKINLHKKNCSISRRISASREFYENEFLEALRPFLLEKDKSLVLDIGAHIGNHTLFFSKICGSRVIAFEPEIQSFGLLKKNIQDNDLSKNNQVTLLNCGLGSEACSAALELNFQDDIGTNATRKLSEIGATKGETQIFALDVIAAEFNLDGLSLIKIDVEGAELDVLYGAKSVVCKYQPVITTEIISIESYQEIKVYLTGLGYIGIAVMNATPTVIWVHPDSAQSKVLALRKIAEHGIFHAIQQGIQSNKIAFQNKKLLTLGKQLELEIVQLTERENARQVEIENLISQIEETRVKHDKDIAKIRDLGKAEKQSQKVELDSIVNALRAQNEALILAYVTVIKQLILKRSITYHIWHKLRGGLISNYTLAQSIFNLKESGVHLSPKLKIPKSRLLSYVQVIKSKGYMSVWSKLRQAIFKRLSKLRRKAKLPVQVDYSDVRPKVLSSNISTLLLASDVVIICEAYPGGMREYGGEFIRTRANAYYGAGLKVVVIELSNKTQIQSFQQGSVLTPPVVRLPLSEQMMLVDALHQSKCRVAAHSPSPSLQSDLQRLLDHSRLIYWFHGAEVRDYRRLFFNYTTEEITRVRQRLDELNQQRLRAANIAFSNPLISKVFVSKFLKGIAENDSGTVSINSHVIPNFIDGSFYKFSEGKSDFKKNVLLMRSFGKHNYANDIAINAIKLLSEREGFSDIKFTICGFGIYFKPLIKKINHLANVHTIERYSNPEQMAKMYSTHGIFLCPSRHDTQGVTLGEAMASGLVCITNRVAAIPEFVDNNCAVLVTPDDPQLFADAIWDSVYGATDLAALSLAAARRVRQQCGFPESIGREIALIGGD